MTAGDLRAARERLTSAAHAVARGDKGAGHEHEKAAIAFVRATDTLEATARASARAETNTLLKGERWSYSREELARAAEVGKRASEKVLKAVQDLSNQRARLLNGAVEYFLAAGVPVEHLRLEIEGETTRLMALSTCVAEVRVAYDMNAYTITQHYKGPALP